MVFPAPPPGGRTSALTLPLVINARKFTTSLGRRLSPLGWLGVTIPASCSFLLLLRPEVQYH